MIPTDSEILITHGPPLGFGDSCQMGDLSVGCEDLYNTVTERVKPLYHIFGHIHEGYGLYTDGTTKFINAASVDFEYNAVNKPIVFDLPIK